VLDTIIIMIHLFQNILILTLNNKNPRVLCNQEKGSIWNLLGSFLINCLNIFIIDKHQDPKMYL